jgi:hypothetical protein
MARLLQQPSLNAAAEEELVWQFSAYDNQSVKYGTEVNIRKDKQRNLVYVIWNFKLLMGGEDRFRVLYNCSITDYHNPRSNVHISFFYCTLLIEVPGIWVVKRPIL